LIVAGSALIVFHLTAIIIPVLDMPSGPWVTDDGPRPANAPEFAHAANSLSTLHGKYLRVAHSFHYVTNRPADIPEIQLEIRLRNDQGEVFETLHFPDANANPWLRHRQEVLASALALDMPVERPTSEIVAPAGTEKDPAKTFIWAVQGEDFSKEPSPGPPPDRKIPRELRGVLPYRVPRTRDVFRPADWSLIVAHSYARYFCRAYGAKSAEIIRHRRDPIPPAVLFGMDAPPQAFDDQIASFGEMSQ
jgi:hypothetical protein